MPAPNVVSTDPLPGATNVSRYRDVVAQFDVPLTYLRHNLAAEPLVMTLEQPAGTVILQNSAQHVVPITFNYNDVRRTAKLRVRVCLKALQPSTTYTAKILGAKSYDGTSMAAPYSWTFTTEAATGGGAGPPTQPVPGYVNWFHADSLALTNGALVPQLTDSSVNANHAAQGTSGNQGTFLANAANGKPAVMFDGATTYYKTANPVNTGSFFVVLNHADIGIVFNTYRRIFDTQDTTGWSLFGNANVGSYNLDIYPRGVDINTFRKNGVVTIAGTPLAAYRVLYGEMSPVNPVNMVVTVGAIYSIGQFLYGNLCEYLIYPVHLSDTDRQSNESYLMNKYAIS